MKSKSQTYLSYVRQAEISQSLSLLPQIKTAVSEYYLSQGQWPSKLSEIHLDEAVMVDNTEGLERIYLENQGSIMMLLDDRWGTGARLAIRPRYENKNSTLYWDCFTSLKKQDVPQGMNCVFE